MIPTTPNSAASVLSTLTPGLFARSTSQGRWQMARHLKFLDQAITDTILGKGGVRRLIVTMPPRHGKSELISRYLPAWFLGTFPDRKVILITSEADAMATYCFPFTAYVIGPLATCPPSIAFHNNFPSRASSA